MNDLTIIDQKIIEAAEPHYISAWNGATPNDVEQIKHQVALMTALAKSSVIETMNLYRNGMERIIANFNSNTSTRATTVDFEDFIRDMDMALDSMKYGLDCTAERIIEDREFDR